MSETRFVLIPKDVWGLKVASRGTINSLLSDGEAFNDDAFQRLLEAKFGPCGDSGDARYSYSIQDNKTGLCFYAYSAQSGPAYGGGPNDFFNDFENGDVSLKATALEMLRAFEKWLSKETAVNVK